MPSIEEEFIAEKDGQALHLNLEISREEYEDLIRPLLLRTMDCVQQALDDCKLTGSAIDKVVLVGGSTRTPLVAQMLEERLGQPAHQEVNPDLCVAMGAGIQAAIVAGVDVGSVLVDITPHSLGIKCLDYPSGLRLSLSASPRSCTATPPCRPAAARSSPPCTTSRTKWISRSIQGEDDDIRNNHRIGNFMIEGLAPVPAGNQIVVQLDLNLDGMLKVSARERATGCPSRSPSRTPWPNSRPRSEARPATASMPCGATRKSRTTWPNF